MAISLKTHKLLWGRSGNRCAFPDCRKELVVDETETDDESIIGDEAHIIGRKERAARGKTEIDSEDRDKYDNLILLCKIHHKVIDDQPGLYTSEKLREIKKTHEDWVKNSLHPNSENEKTDLRYATDIDGLVTMLDFDNWNAWTSPIFSNGQPRISYNRLKELEKIPEYILSRFWPKKYANLEKAVFNLKNVLNDFIKVFYEHVDIEALEYAKKNNKDHTISTKKFYQIDKWDPELYNKLFEDFEYHVALVEDLGMELTRAGNFLIEEIRNILNSKYRDKEGKLLITSGPFMDGNWKTYKLEYKVDERNKPMPYGGLKAYMTERESRDLYMGKGVSKKYLPDKFDL